MPDGAGDLDRRRLLRAGAALGLAAAAGVPLVGCGGGSGRVAAPVPAEPAATAEPVATRAPRSKSDLYRRGEGDVAVTDPVPTRTAPPTAGPAEPGAPTAESAVPAKSDGLSTARRRRATSAPGTERGPVVLGRVEEVPVGGGKVYEKQKIVVTQPTPGEYKAFDARCTHQGCTVAGVRGGTIHCPCHESRFNIADGTVTQGPAKRPLPVKGIEVVDGEFREVRPAPTAD